MTGLDSRVLLDPADGSLGPLLRLADDRLEPGSGYGPHAHRDVDVVAVVLAGSLTHRWNRPTGLGAGDVAVLRAGTGLRHDEVAGTGGARLLQTYLRAAVVGGAPTHEVHRTPAGWVDLDRPDARLWIGPATAGQSTDPPPGLRLVARGATVAVDPSAGPVRGAAWICVWQLDTARPAWAG